MGGKAEKREQIMKAAEELFVSRRFHEITMDEIAHRAGVGKGTIYRYFEDKEDLFSEVAMAGYDALCRLVEQGAVPDADFEAALIRVCTGIREFFHVRHRLWHLMQAEDRRQFWRRGGDREKRAAHRRKLMQALVGVLRRGVDEGAIRADMSLSALALLLLGMIRNSVCTHDESSSLSAPEVVELFLRGAGGQ